MRIRVLFATGLASILHLLCLSAPAQDPKPMLPADVVPSAFRAYLVTDGRFPPVKTPEGKDVADPRNRAGKIHCLVCEYGLAPVVAVFVRADAKNLAGDSGVVKLAKGVDALIPKHRTDKLAAFVMFLRLEGDEKKVKTVGPKGEEVEFKVDKEYPDDEMRDLYSMEIKGVADAANVPNVPFGLAADKSKALTAWGINDKADVTVILYYRMRKIGNPWKFNKVADLTDEKVTEILKATETAITGKK